MRSNSRYWAMLQVSRHDDFTGGLNLRADAFQLGANESPDLLNVDIDPRGGFSSRPGTLVYNPTIIGGGDVDTGIDPWRLWRWERTQPQMFLTAGTQIFYTDPTVSDSFVNLEITCTNGYGASLASWTTDVDTNLYIATGITSGSTSGYVWDGAAATALTRTGAGEYQDDLTSPTGTHMPTAEHCAAHIDRMWVASTTENGSAFPNRIRFSHPFFPQSWRTDDYIDIVDGGSGITGLCSYGGNLVVFKKHSVFMVMGYSTETFQVVPVTLDYGCVNPHAFTEHQSVLYFYDRHLGLAAFNGVHVVNLFTLLAPELSDKHQADADVDAIRVSSLGRKIWVSVPFNDDATYVYDPTLTPRGGWTRYQLAESVRFGAGTEFNGRRCFAHPTRPLVFYLDDDTYLDLSGNGAEYDAGLVKDALFPSHYVTRWQDAGYVSVKKRWRRVDLVAHQTGTAEHLNLKVFYDWQEGLVRRTSIITVKAVEASNGLVWGVGDWGVADWGGGVVGSQYVRTAPLGPARAVQVMLSGPGGASWGINSITYKYNFRRLRA